MLVSAGEGISSYGFTGEMHDGYIELLYLRSRYYSLQTGRFLTKDLWHGDTLMPMSNNAWIYGYSNPIAYTDPTGEFPTYCHKMPNRHLFEDCVRDAYGLERPLQYDLAPSLGVSDKPGCYYVVSPDFPIPYDGPGYLEGFGPTDFGVVTAKELVYDFSTMSSAEFDVGWGAISDSILGFSISTYFGIVGDTVGNGFSSQRSINDYSGPFLSVTVGASLPFDAIVPSVGAYKSSFMALSLNPMMGHSYGIYWGMSMDPIPILDITVSITNSELKGSTLSFYTLTDPAGYKYVDVARMRCEILTGNQSPWNDPKVGALFYSPLIPARLNAVTMVDKWAKIYNELHNGW